jgi:hypothetical protein
MMNAAGIDQARSLLGNLLFFAMRRPDARTNAAFKYVSADWIDLPGWFFWPKNRPGVFLLKLNCINDALPDVAIETDYRLSYFPALAEPLFEQFSCAEQLLRASEYFSRKGVEFATECPHCECNDTVFADLSSGKGIPTPEARRQISGELFTVGAINFRWELEVLTRISMRAPFHDQTLAQTAVEITTESGPLRLLEAGAVDRDLPCWELAADFLPALVEFLPVDILRRSFAGGDEKEGKAMYSVRQNLCRTTGIVVEYAR